MSGDIVVRLRDAAKFGNPGWHQRCLKLADEAAEEIDGLRAELTEAYRLREEPDEQQ